MKFTKQYLSILSSDLKVLNLTRIIEPKEFHEKQYLYSIIPFQISTELSLENQLHVDVGFGGGFPCLPLAYEFSSLNFRTIGIEAREKKVKAVNLIAKKMNLNKFTGYHARVEDIIFDQKCLVTFKAVGKISKFLSMMNVSNLDLKVIFYKGPGLSDL